MRTLTDAIGDFINKFDKGKNKIIDEVANQIINNTVRNINKSSYDGVSYKEVQRRIKGTDTYNNVKPYLRTRKILVNSGALRNSFYVSYKSWKKIVISSSVDYASIHNSGIGVPKRQFLGNSEKNLKDIKRIILKYIKK
jgi:phage gpG-like protein